MQSLSNLSPDLSLCIDQVNVETINKRIKVYHIPEQNKLDTFINYLIDMGKEKSCDKIIFYVKEKEKFLMEERQHVNYEGMIKGFFNGDVSFIYALFLSEKAGVDIEEEKEKKVLNIAKNFFNPKEKSFNNRGYSIRWANSSDRFKMAVLYDTVFESYPTPMNDPKFILKMMNSEVYFSVAEKNGEIVSACSADVMPSFNAAELSDCATIPAHRGKGLLFKRNCSGGEMEAAQIRGTYAPLK